MRRRANEAADDERAGAARVLVDGGPAAAPASGATDHPERPEGRRTTSIPAPEASVATRPRPLIGAPDAVMPVAQARGT